MIVAQKTKDVKKLKKIYLSYDNKKTTNYGHLAIS